MSNRLKNLKILVTRPEAQAENISRLLEMQGAHPILFPTLEIVALHDSAFDAAIAELPNAEIAIFISANAVQFSMPAINAIKSQLTDRLQIATPGSMTAALLKKYGFSVVIYPQEQFNSEALLALSIMQSVERKKIILFRGEGGRTLLADTLRQRGAEVIEAICYKRKLPKKISIIPSCDEIDIVMITSETSLENLFYMMKEECDQWLAKSTLLVASERIASKAQQLGFMKPCIIAENASDQAMLSKLLTYQEVVK